MSYQLVWFKRDLRWQDHEALTQAAQLGPVRCIYVVEPTLWLQPDAALQHFEFVRESLQELDQALRLLGGCMEIHCGEMTDVLGKIWHQSPFAGLHAHQETGNGMTYQRDLKVHAWCQGQSVGWHEYPQFGVVRGLRNRDLWRKAWEAHMAAPQQTPTALVFWQAWPAVPAESAPLQMQAPAHLRHNPPLRQHGGRALALQTLHSFLQARCLGYRGGLSSPLSAPDACSRLSAYLAWGCISMREVVQHTRWHLHELPPQAQRHRAGLTAFVSRLYWHCHFIQKLESEPDIEWRNMHRGYDGLREQDFNADHFEALKSARTGWPMVDACVAMLAQTGWLNFRMRAMLVSVAAYPLWLHWRPVGEWLATQFLDYEPGIHWSQLQMQSGTTGINTTRIYNPIKQAQDHDPHGTFVRHWLPPMQRVPDSWLFEPWRMPESVQANVKVRIGTDMAHPVVDLAQATRASKHRLHARRQQPDVKAGTAAVVDKHASRGGPSDRSPVVASKSKRLPAKSTAQSPAQQQMGFDF